MRAGTFSSSAIYKLTTNGKAKGELGKPALTYIRETQIELRLGRALNTDLSSRPALWGTLVEAYVNDMHVGLEYELASTERLVHPELKHWTGAPDLISETCVGDIKCPQLKAFCELSDICLSGDVFELKSSYHEYYWQLVSNAILTGKEEAELMIFCPYQDELNEIRLLAKESDDKFKFIIFSDDSELPYLIRGGYYSNVARMRWNVNEEDKAFLTQRVRVAIDKLYADVKIFA